MFQGLRLLKIPEGDVVKVELNGVVLWETPKLPDEYEQVEWIQANSDVGAYIDLGFSYDKGATIDLGLYIMNDNTSYPFGAVENNGVLRCCLSMPYVNNGADTGTFYYTNQSGTYDSKPIKYNKGVENKYLITIKDNSITILNKTTGDMVQDQNVASITMTNNLYLFAQYYNRDIRYGDVRRISYFRYYDNNNVLICDMIPCYRKSDNVIGMYDLARKQFFTNIGTGTFIKNIVVKKNYVQYSTESDGITIYNNGKGYKDGYRVRSGGEEGANTPSVCTGFIPFVKSDKLYIYPPFNGGNVDNAINFFDSNYTNLGQITDMGSAYGFCTTAFKTKLVNGVSVLDISDVTVSGIENVAYVRITNKIANGAFINSGSEMIITKNEEIIV